MPREIVVSRDVTVEELAQLMSEVAVEYQQYFCKEYLMYTISDRTLTLEECKYAAVVFKNIIEKYAVVWECFVRPIRPYVKNKRGEATVFGVIMYYSDGEIGIRGARELQDNYKPTFNESGIRCRYVVNYENRRYFCHEKVGDECREF